MKAYDHTLDPAKVDPPLTISRSDPIFGGAFEPDAPDADRVNAYAEAITNAWHEGTSDVSAVIALADREQATLLAKIAELEAEVGRLHERLADSERTIMELSGRLRRRERALADERAIRARVERALLQGGRDDGTARRQAIAALDGPAEREASKTGGDA